MFFFFKTFWLLTRFYRNTKCLSLVLEEASFFRILPRSDLLGFLPKYFQRNVQRIFYLRILLECSLLRFYQDIQIYTLDLDLLRVCHAKIKQVRLFIYSMPKQAKTHHRKHTQLGQSYHRSLVYSPLVLVFNLR